MIEINICDNCIFLKQTRGGIPFCLGRLHKEYKMVTSCISFADRSKIKIAKSKIESILSDDNLTNNERRILKMFIRVRNKTFYVMGKT